MRDLRNRLRAAALLCAAGSVSSFLPSFPPARAKAGRSVGPPCTEGVATRRSTPRVSLGSRLRAGADQPGGHAVRDGGQETSTIDGSSSSSGGGGGDTADSSSGKDSLLDAGGLNAPSAAAGASSAGAAEPGEGRASAVGGEEGAEQMPTMAAVAQEVEALAAGGGHSSAGVEESTAGLLAQQPGGPEETADGEEEYPKPTRVRKRLKKYFPKDFQDSSWTVAVQWNHSKYEVKTTKVALKADGSVVWLDKGKGSWVLRTKSRDLSIYRNYFLNWAGLRIYSAKLLDNTCDMYLSGVIKGWQPFLPLSRMGTWQAVRRGIKVDENTPRPPWESMDLDGEVEFEDGRKKRNKPIEVEVDLS